MGEETGYIFEGERRRRWFTRFSWSRAAIAVSLATIAVNVGLFATRSGSGQKHGSGGTTSSASNSPTPSPTPSSVGARLTGVGPFAIVQVGDSSSRYIAIDLGNPKLPRIVLGIPPGQLNFDVSSIQAWGRVAPIASQADAGVNVWFLAKGRGFDDQPLVIPEPFDRSLTSPDGKQMVVVRVVPNDFEHADLVIVTTDGSPPRTIRRILTSGSNKEDGVLSPLVWLPDGGWLALPICQCEGDPLAWYTISSTGRVSVADWLRPSFGLPGASEDGRYLSFLDEPTRDCSTTAAPETFCANGPARVLVVDTLTHRIRVLATSANDITFRSTAMSPDGSLVAAPVSGSPALRIYDRKSGRPTATVRFGGQYLSAAAFVDDATLLLTGTSGPGQGGLESLFLARIEFGGVKVTKLAAGIPGLVGWTR